MTGGLDSEAFDGDAVVSVDDVSVRLGVQLRAFFEPNDGRFHWYGRLAADPALDATLSGREATITTPTGSAPGRLSDVDPWGRFRIAGFGRPPF